MTSELDSPYGYPLRRNSSSCLSTEQDCGMTWGVWRRCCPHGTSCADDCCPSEADCQQRIKAHPHCANDTADLYSATDAKGSPAGGYFCCMPENVGFQRQSDSWVGCADSVDLLNSSYSLASLVKAAGSSSTSVTVSSTATATATTSAATNTSTGSSSSSSSSTNAGATAGGVVGGVAGAALILALVWFFIHRRKKQSSFMGVPTEAAPTSATPTTSATSPHAPTTGQASMATGSMSYLPAEVPKPQPLAELQATSEGHTVQELEGRTVYELPGRR